MTFTEPSRPAPVTAGVDLGGTKIQTVVLRNEEVIGSSRVPTPQSGDAAGVVDAIVGTITTSLEAAGSSEADLEGIGIGTPSEVDSRSGTVEKVANIPGFSERVALGPLVSRQLGDVKVTVDNDVNAGVLGEYRRGAGRPYSNLLGVWVGTGVGDGLILAGKPHAGRGAAGEIGHPVVRPRGPRCSCGRRGCLEAYAGRASMERRARALVKRGHKTSLFRIMEKQGRTRLTSGVCAHALAQGDPTAKRLIDDPAWALGIALATAQNLLDLEAIIVGGGLADRLGQPFVDQVIEQMTPHLFAADSPLAVLRTELGDLSGAVGAAVLASS